MNFYDNIPNFNNYNQGLNNPMMNNNPVLNTPIINNDINYKILELENRIKKLELRITHLENEKTNNNYTEPDNSLYMI